MPHVIAPTVYLAAPSSALADAARATAALIRRGYDVMTASFVSASAPLAEHIASTSKEVIFAGVMGVPVVALADALGAGVL